MGQTAEGEGQRELVGNPRLGTELKRAGEERRDSRSSEPC